MPEVTSPDWLSWGFWAQDHESIRDLVITLAALVGIPFVIWREWLHHRQTKAALQQAEVARQQAATAQLRHEEQVKADRERRITDNFTRAVELLGSDKLATRSGAIYALERIARESPTDHWPIIETLAAYVRDRAPRSAQREASQPKELVTDIQACLSVIGRRRSEHDGPEQRLNLRATNLRFAQLTDAHLQSAILSYADLRETVLIRAHLERAWLRGAHLEGALLFDAHLEGAWLKDACLTGADLHGADLSGTNITQEQFDSAISDERTKVPPHIKRPKATGELAEAPQVAAITSESA